MITFKTSLLSTLEQGKIGLEATVENLEAASLYIDAKNCTGPRGTMFPGYIPFFFVDDLFHRDVKSLMLKRLVQYNNPTGLSILQESILVKALDAIEKFQNMIGLIDALAVRCSENGYNQRQEITSTFNERDIDLLIDLWTSVTDEKVINHFVKVFRWLWMRNANKSLLSASNIYIKSLARMKGYVPLHLVLPVRLGFNVFQRVNQEEPSFLSTFVKSATCLVNCWRSLHAADMICERQWIEGRMRKWMEVILNHVIYCITLMHNSNAVKDELLLKKEVGRFLHCVTFAIVQTPHDVAGSVVLRKFLWKYVNLVINLGASCESQCPSMPRNLVSLNKMRCWYFFVLFSKHEVSELLAKCHEDNIVKRTLHFIWECEQKLQPLSREDTKVFAFPDHVKDAVESLPDSDLLFEPDVGCLTLLRANRHRLSATEWTNDILKTLDRLKRYTEELY